MAIEIFDTPQNITPLVGQLKELGVKIPIRYISSINPSGEKCIKPAEARAIANAGMALAIVHEGWGGANGRGISAMDGHRDGPWSVRYMATIGAPRGAAVYFAVDTDENAASIRNQVLPYFKAIKEAFDGSPYTIGVYGSGAVLAAVSDALAGQKVYTWLSCSKGWDGYQEWKSKADLVQSLPVRLKGLDIDPDSRKNFAQGSIGEFVPFQTATEINDLQKKIPQPTPTTGFDLAGLFRKIFPN